MFQGATRKLATLLAGLSISCAIATRAAAGPGGVLKLEVVDRDTKQPLACRMHLTNAAKKALKAPKVPFYHDHFVFDGSIAIKLPKGEYDFDIERGPEYLVRHGHFTMDDFSDDTQTVDLGRFVNMAADGWWSGDLDVQRPAKDLQLLMRADDLHFVQLVTWPGGKSLLAKSILKGPVVQFDETYFLHLAAGVDARAGGQLLFFNTAEPLDLAGADSEFPPQQASIETAKRQTGAWVDARNAFGWDLPIWIASGGLDSIELAGSHLGRKSAAANESGGKPRDKLLFPDPTGVGRWNERIYYHLLNCGLHVVPTAGSGSGTAANPLGYNRMYVHVDGPISYDKWWDGARAGRVVVTNGPIIRPNVEGELPGHVFHAPEGSRVELEVGLSLSTRDPVAYLEIIKDGTLAQQYRLDEWAQMGGKLPPLVFDESGWFVIRAVADVPSTYRFASTAPYYVEIGGQPRISRSSVQFFVDWLAERTAAVEARVSDERQRKAVLQFHEKAHKFWQDLLARSNAR